MSHNALLSASSEQGILRISASTWVFYFRNGTSRKVCLLNMAF